MKLIFTLYFILGATYCVAQGDYIDRVPVGNSDGESYALYLPKSYRATDKTSILVVFSPDGVGQHGVDPFKKVADERGMIVVSSNDCKNGPYEYNLAIAQRLFNQVFSQYSIDPNQIYLSGFSGGSRLASAIASLSGNIAGVIACGAAFSGTPEHNPQSNEGFVWLGIIGDRDFNYKEMLDTSAFLKKLQYPHGLQLFSGSHEWPPTEETIAAFRFIELQLHKQEKITLLPERIEAYFKEDCRRLAGFEERNDLIKKAAEYDRMLSAYSQIRVSDSLFYEKQQFLKTSEYKSQKKQEEKAIATEQAFKRKLGLRFTEDFKEPDRANWKSWEKEINKLKESTDVPVIHQMHRRVLFWLYVMTYPGENPMLNRATSAQLEFSKRIGDLVRG